MEKLIKMDGLGVHDFINTTTNTGSLTKEEHEFDSILHAIRFLTAGIRQK